MVRYIGFEAELHLEPEHAFGDYDSSLVCFEQRSLFPETLEAGMQFEGLPEGAITDQGSEGMAIGKLCTDLIAGIDVIGDPMEMRQHGRDCVGQRPM